MRDRIVLWGTYDLGKPRTRILRASLRNADFDVDEIHVSVWEDIDDKSQLSATGWIKRAARWIAAYPRLVWRYLRTPAHKLVVVPYMGHLDVLILWPFARMRGVPIVWDAFLSLHDTVVADRKMVGANNPIAWLIHAWEWLACRAASGIVLDTRAQAQLFEKQFGLKPGKARSVFVGAETDSFILPAAPPSNQSRPLKVLFYGQFIPLHGVETIIEAARLARDESIEWHLVGDGQVSANIRAMLGADPLPKVRWTPWIPYDELKQAIADADICLGVFGTSDKAARVIPNKVFQILAAGKPLITRDSPAIRELVKEGDKGVRLVKPGDGKALLNAIREMSENLTGPQIADRFAPETLAEEWKSILLSVQAGADRT